MTLIITLALLAALYELCVLIWVNIEVTDPDDRRGMVARLQTEMED